jgi:hypothetical protein
VTSKFEPYLGAIALGVAGVALLMLCVFTLYFYLIGLWVLAVWGTVCIVLLVVVLWPLRQFIKEHIFN